MQAIIQPFSPQSLGDIIKSALKGEDIKWKSFQAAVAFVKRSGVQHIEAELRSFVEQGGYVRLILGIDHYGTSLEGLADLLAIVGDKGEIWINHEPSKYVTFHPKIYLFENETSALLIVGSGNLTQGGLYRNDEASLLDKLDLTNQEDRLFLETLKTALNNWSNNELESIKRLDEGLLKALIEEGYIRPEVETITEDEAETAKPPQNERDITPQRQKTLFGRGPQRPVPRKSTSGRRRKIQIPLTDEQSNTTSEVSLTVIDQFIVTVLHGDLPQRGSSNEIRLAKGIRDINPAFWGWRDKFTGPDSKGQYHRDIKIWFDGKIIKGYLKDFPARKPDGTKASGDFRIGAIGPIVKKLQEEGDIVILETPDIADVDFIANVIPKSNQELYEEYFESLIEYERAKSSITRTYRKYKYEIKSG